MSLFVDSADLVAIARVIGTGVVAGATTNPALLALTGRPAVQIIPELCELVPGTVFYQCNAETIEARHAEADAMLSLAPDRVGIKIAASSANLALVDALAMDCDVAVTALYTPAQAVLAAYAGARYVIPYVNRMSRLLGDGMAILRQIRAALDATGTGCEILAASIKSPEEAVDALLAGAHHLSLPPDVLWRMGEHPLSDAAVEEFARVAREG